MQTRINHLIIESVRDTQCAPLRHAVKPRLMATLLVVGAIVLTWHQGLLAQTNNQLAQDAAAAKPTRLDLPPNILSAPEQSASTGVLQPRHTDISRTQLAQYVRQVLEQHPALLRTEARSRAADYRIEEAKSARYPQLIVSGDLGREHRDRPAVDNEKFNRAQAQLRVVLPVYDPAVNARIAQRNSEAVSSGWQLTDKREQLVLQTIESYIALARATRLLTLAQDSLKTHRLYVAQVKERSKTHGAVAADMPAATARVALAEATATRYLHQLENARASWWKLTGLQAPNQLHNVPFANLPETLDDALAEAHRDNPEIKLAQADIAVAKQSIDVDRSPYKPTVNLEMRTRNGRDWDGVAGHQARHYAGVTFEWKAFSGFADGYATKAAQEEVLAAQYAFDETHQALRMRMEQEWFNLQSSDAMLQSYQAYEEQAQLMVKTSQDKFMQGQRPLLEVLDAEKELLAARMQVEGAHQDMVLSSWRLLALQGRIQSVLEQ